MEGTSENNAIIIDDSPVASGDETLNNNQREEARQTIINYLDSDDSDSIISSPVLVNNEPSETDNRETGETNRGKTREEVQCQTDQDEFTTQLQNTMQNIIATRQENGNDANLNKRGRRWVFTWNNPPPDWKAKLIQFKSIKALQIKFLICELEHGEERNTEHVQGYIRSSARLYYRTLRTKIPAWWDLAVGDENDNISYCTKEGSDILRLGVPDTKGGKKLVSTNERIKNLRSDVISMSWAEFEDKHPMESTYQQSIWLKYRYEHTQNDKIWDGELKSKNYWVWGAPGTGKSAWAWSQQGKIYVKLQNKWWDGFHLDTYTIVLIEDWGSDKGMLAPNLKQWADRYKFIAEVKGGTIWINPGQYRLIITSNYSIEQCFQLDDARALQRRFTEIQINNPEDIRLLMQTATQNE